MIKAIFLDVDGTLISFNTHHIPQTALDALRQAYHSGCKLIIATGRSAADLQVIREVPYEAVISLNGAECVLRDFTPIYKKLIPTEDFHKALELSKKYDFPLALETNEGIFVNKLNPIVIEIARLIDHPVPTVIDIEKKFAEVECSQLCFYCDEETEKKVIAQIPNLFASRWHPIFADVNVRGVDKGMGLGILADYYKIDISETLAFGDGGNDIHMLRKAGTGIAMGSASDEVKAAADYVTDTVDNHGIRNALIRLGIIRPGVS